MNAATDYQHQELLQSKRELRNAKDMIQEAVIMIESLTVLDHVAESTAEQFKSQASRLLKRMVLAI